MSKYYFAVFMFFTIFSISIIAVIIKVYALFEQFTLLPDTIVFDKGVFYLLGVAFISATLGIAILYEHWFAQLFTKQFKSTISKVLIFGMLFTLLIPQGVHYAVHIYLSSKNYELSETKAYPQIRFNTIVYDKIKNTYRKNHA